MDQEFSTINLDKLAEVERLLTDLIKNLPERSLLRDQEIDKIHSTLRTIREELSTLGHKHGALADKFTRFEKSEFVTKEEVMQLVKEISKEMAIEFEAQRAESRRSEIREEMALAIRDYFSWKRVSVFLVGAIGFIETTLRILSAVGWISRGS